MEHPLQAETAISEVLGAIILVSIISVAFGIIGVSMLSQPHEKSVPALNIVISNNSQKITVYHAGGDPLQFSEMKILLDGVDSTTSFTKGGSGGWTSWAVGETLEYAIPTGQHIPASVQVVFKGAMSDYLLSYSGKGEGIPLTGLPPSVTGITPNSAPAESVVAITNLAGSGFYNGAAVILRRAGSSDIPATGVTVVSSTQITCSFGLTGAALGVWDVVVTSSDGLSGTLPNAFTVTPSTPPIVKFMGTPLSGIVPLTVAFTDQSTLSPTSWSWSFGDGNTSSARNPSNTYTSPGYYTVSLTATNTGGSNTSTVNNYVFAYSPLTANFTGAPASGKKPLTVTFSDMSTGSPTSWYWVFGDMGVANTSTLQNPAHTYSGVGLYSVNLTVSNAFNTSFLYRTNYVNVTQPRPAASFLAFPTSGVVPLTVYFNDTSTNSPTIWSWIFGDLGAGNTSSPSNPNPVHVYTTPGTYTVTLTVTNTGGSDTTSSNITVTPPVVADFTATPTSVLTSQTVQFNDTSTGSPTSWSWVFGDIGAGNTSTVRNATHAYSSAGTYSVTLTASKSGSSNTMTRANYITVNWAPPTVNGITPASATTGTTVSITNLSGTAFRSGATVKLTKSGSSDISATSVTVVSATQITCQFNLAGAATGTWNVVVTNPDAQSGTLANGFTVINPAPTVTSITPSTGVNTSSVSITNLAGTGFLSGATVKLNRTGYADILGTSVTVVSANQITCTFAITGKKAGQWNVAVTNTDGQSGMLANGFTITAPQASLFYDNFESGFAGWTTVGTVARGTYTPRNGTYDIRLTAPTTTTNAQMSRGISTSGYQSVIVRFAWAAQSLESGEFLYAEYSTDGGSGWTTLTSITNTGTPSSLTVYTSAALPSAAENNANFQLRFRLAAQRVGSNNDYGYVDDVLVRATPI